MGAATGLPPTNYGGADSRRPFARFDTRWGFFKNEKGPLTCLIEFAELDARDFFMPHLRPWRCTHTCRSPAGVEPNAVNSGKLMKHWDNGYGRRAHGKLFSVLGYTPRVGGGIGKETKKCSSPVDVLVAVAGRLSLYENRRRITREDFYDKYRKGGMDGSVDFVEWANDYRHFLAIRVEVEKHLPHVA